jgi:hypothetical protein
MWITAALAGARDRDGVNGDALRRRDASRMRAVLVLVLVLARSRPSRDRSRRRRGRIDDDAIDDG